MLPADLRVTIEHIPARDLVHDVLVNPRNPSDAWARKQMEEYNAALLGAFIVSERILPGEEGGEPRRQLVVLDGANRIVLMKLVGDEDRAVLCNVFHDLTTEQEATVAREYNDRRNWTGIRIFQSKITAGDPVACQIRDIVDKHGWVIDTSSGDGVFRGVDPFLRLIRTAGFKNAAEAKAQRGSAQYRAAMESGTRDAMRVLDEAVQVYTQAFRERPGSYAANIIYGIALVLLKYGSRIDLTRLTTQLRDESNGSVYVVSDARALGRPMGLPFPDAVAALTIRFYNKGLQRGSKAWIDDQWTKLSR